MVWILKNTWAKSPLCLNCPESLMWPALASGLGENSVPTLVTRLAGRTRLYPSQMPAPEALVPDFQGIHGRFTVVTLWGLRRVPCPPIGTIALSALVVHHVLCLVRHRAGDFAVLLQSVLCLKHCFESFHRLLRSSGTSPVHTRSHSLLGETEGRICPRSSSPWPEPRMSRFWQSLRIPRAPL